MASFSLQSYGRGMWELVTQLGLVFAGIVAANVAFNAFEKHLPLWRRVLKHGMLFMFLAAVRIAFGGWALLATLVVFATGQLVLHGWYFPKHGVNGLTAEPYERYLELITRMKGGRR